MDMGIWLCPCFYGNGRNTFRNILILFWRWCAIRYSIVYRIFDIFKRAAKRLFYALLQFSVYGDKMACPDSFILHIDINYSNLDRLFVRYGFTKATLLLGFIWGIWHLAWYFTPGQAQYDLLQNSVWNAIMYIPSVMIFNFAVSYVYIKTKRSILSGALVHMFSNLLGSQLISPYSVELSMVIRYTKMFFCGCLALYCIFSKRFQEEYNKLFQGDFSS